MIKYLLPLFIFLVACTTSPYTRRVICDQTECVTLYEYKGEK